MSHSKKRKQTDTESELSPLKQARTEYKKTTASSRAQYSLSLATSGSDPSPAFGKPHQLTCFSYTPQRELRFNKSALKYYVPAPLNADLGYRYEHWIKRPEERGRIDSLLRAIEQDHVVAERKKGVFVGWRGVMTKLMIAPLETRDSVDLNLMYVDGCIYAEEHSTDAKLAEKESMAPNHRRMTYYGYSFESFSTWDEPLKSREQHEQRDRVRCWSGDVDTNVQFCSIVKTKIGAERMILGGEVDCCRDRYTGQSDSYVELKTSMAIRNAQDEQRFERKLLKFWAQSFLLGIPEIVVGFRTPQGRITTLQSFETLALPRMVRGKPHAWDPKPCLAFAEKLLRFIRSTLDTNAQRSKHDGTPPLSEATDAPTDIPEPDKRESQTSRDQGPDQSVWRLEIRPNGQSVTLYKLDPGEIEQVRNGEDRVGFLPTWFWKSVTGTTQM